MARHPDWQFHALGGKHLGAAIAGHGRWLGDTTGCSAIGVLTSVPIYFRAKIVSERMRAFVRRHGMSAVVLCDWGGFNCRQLPFFRKHGVPVLYYFPPRSWQRAGIGGLNIAQQVRRVATPFEWSERRLRSAGCDAEWVGHPLLEASHTPAQRGSLRREFGIKEGQKLVALLPGSRMTELRVLAPRMAQAAELLRQRHQAKFIVAVPETLAARARRYFPASIQIVSNRTPEALLASDAAIVKTGTATLEASVIGTPQIAVYDFGWLRRIEWLALWMWRKIPFIAMPNIILQRGAVPELLGLDCKAEGMAIAIGELLEDEILRARMEAAYVEVRRALGAELPQGATARTAEILEEMVGVREAAADGEQRAEA